ncbi:hypothetical protein LJR251_002102 [Rhizobium rhizogenes]|uniref:hypothetical protein n=1 Tax=Rhizobium rhizogenes TaxID=359 RepID=UPI003ECFCBBB
MLPERNLDLADPIVSHWRGIVAMREERSQRFWLTATTKQQPDRRMTDASSFISELVRAANEVQKLTGDEVRALLLRAIVTIKELREAVGIPGAGTPNDMVVVLFDITNRIGYLDEAQRASALLEAAEQMRTLRIVANSGTRIVLKQADFDPG